MRRVIYAVLLCVAMNMPSFVYALSVSVSVPERYATVKAGERLYFELSIKYPENRVRKDLRLTYTLLHGESVLAQSKVLRAIETQASFIDYMVVPENVDMGLYTVRVMIEDYENLHKETETTFTVVPNVNKVARLFGVLVLFGITVVILLLIVQIMYTRSRWKKMLYNRHDYSNIPQEKRVYYEMISGVIAQMRARVGRKSISLAQTIDGLTVSDQGRVDSINRDPSEILAELVHAYKRKFGKNVNFIYIQ